MLVLIPIYFLFNVLNKLEMAQPKKTLIRLTKGFKLGSTELKASSMTIIPPFWSNKKYIVSNTYFELLFICPRVTRLR